MINSKSKEKIRNIRRAGLLYKAIVSTEENFKNGFGFCWKFFILNKMIFFKDYKFKEKIEVIKNGFDRKNKLVEEIFKSKYYFLKKDYKNYLKKIIDIGEADPQKIRSLYSVINEIFCEDIYQIKKLAINGDTIINCGANIGIFDIYSSLLYPESKIISFEPEKGNYTIAKKLTKSFKNININNYALGDKKANKRLLISDNNLLHTINDSSYDLEKNHSNYQNVKMTTIDSFIKDKVDIIKIDTEGYEKKVILGSKETIKNYLPLLLVSKEHNFNQKNTNIETIKEISKKYRFIDLNSDVSCFYIPKKHKHRIKNMRRKDESKIHS